MLENPGPMHLLWHYGRVIAMGTRRQQALQQKVSWQAGL
jgi:hypothetical protein